MKFFLPIFLFLSGMHVFAGLTFEEMVIEAHADLNAKTVTRDFSFSNKGSKPVTIREADAGCSCLAVQVSGGKLTYAPGETGVIRAIFELGSFQGAVDKPINVWLDGDPDEQPSSTVVLRVHIPQIISIEPRSVKWEVGGDTALQIMDVKMDYEKPIHISAVHTSNSDFEAKLITVKDGEHYQIEITPKNLGQPGLSIIRIETDVDVEKQRIQQGFAVMKAKK